MAPMAPEEAKASYKKRLTDLLKDPSLSRSRDGNKPSIPKIRKVQPYLRQRTKFQQYYSPKLLSIGPIHHGHRNLMLGEHYKKRWARAYLENDKVLDITKTAVQQLRQKAQNITEEVAQQLNQYGTEAVVQQLSRNIAEEAAQQLQGAAQQLRQNITEAAVQQLRQNIAEAAAQQLQHITEVAAQQLPQSIIEVAAQQLCQNIASKIEYLKELYSEDAIKKYKGKDDDLIWTFFVDGCSVLHILKKANDVDIDDGKTLEIKIDEYANLLQDMLLLENQLPFELLTLLTGDNDTLEQSMLKLLQDHHMVRNLNQTAQPKNENQTNAVKVPIGQSAPVHLLDLLHKILIEPSSSRKPPHGNWLDLLLRRFWKSTNPVNDSQSGGHHQSPSHSFTIRSIRELKAAGIEVTRSEKKSLQDVKFTSNWFWGVLELPEIIVDDFTAPTFMNLIAYEMCPGFDNKFQISSFIAFLDLLIDHPDDVKELRSARVLQNNLGNDEEVANLFNTISTDLIADVSKYASLRNKIEDHCSVRWKTWFAQAWHDHFSSPWSFVALLTAVIITGLTIVQTWFAIWPESR